MFRSAALFPSSWRNAKPDDTVAPVIAAGLAVV
jgi:hypothetical protein